MSSDPDYTKASKYNLVAQRRNHRLFILSLRRRPKAAVAVILAFVVLGVALAGISGLEPAHAGRRVLPWLPALLAIAVAAYLTGAVLLVEIDSDPRSSSPAERERKAARWHAANTYLREIVTGPVLMLDIDGVLHFGQSGKLNKLPMLQAWLREHPQVQVVISSDWRYSDGFDKVRLLFDRDLRGRVIGSTPVIEQAPREQEIMELVTRCGIERWATLDDAADGFPTMKDHLVKTDPRVGLVEADLALLAQKLGVE